MDEKLAFIYRRRSIRKFTDQPIEPEKITELLKAAMAAPTAMNTQPWQFVVVTEEELLKKIRNTLVFGKMNAPLAIVVCGNMGVFNKRLTGKFWVQDCSAATQNILLAASALGLGSVWCGVHPIHTFEHRISQVLSLPAEVTPLNVIYIGYPAEEKPARTQYDPAKVSWNGYKKAEPSSEDVADPISD